MEDILIIGSGMAGLSAAVYAGRYELKTTVVGEMLGGATTQAWTIENYPGFKAIDGVDLINNVKEQAEALGAKIENAKIEKLEKQGDIFVATTDANEKFEAKSVILALGAKRRKLNLPKEDDFATGKGVHYCLTCDGPFYKNKTIAVIGGGDAAVKGLGLAVQYAEKIHLVSLADKITAEPVNLKKIEKYLGNKIETHFNSEVAEILGEDRINGIKLKSGEELKIDGLFVEIGAVPDSELTKPLGLKTDDKGYVEVDKTMATSIEGIFAAGDASGFFGHFKQDITAAAMGAVAATTAFEFLQKQ